MPVDPSGLQDALEKIAKQYKDVVRMGDRYDNPRRIPFESPMMNYVTGGGIPVGRWSRMWGQSSSGKTRLTYGVMAAAQRMGMTVAYYNIEQQYHIDHVRACGVDVSKLHVVNTQRIEEIGEIAEKLMGSIHLHVFDSCSAGTSIDELRSDITDWPRAIKARAWGKAFDRISDRFDDRENTVICIDQARMSQRTAGGLEPWGSMAMEHQSSLTLKFQQGSWLFRQADGELEEQGKNDTRVGRSPLTDKTEPDGIEVLVRVDKSRVGRPLQTALLRLDYDGMQLDTVWELTKTAVGLNLINKNGAHFYIPVEGSEKPLHFHGMPKLREHIRSDAALQAEIIDTLFDSQTQTAAA
jgi:RecA/RadA recombinase